ncbi:unnamed protein product [Rotaria sp. Silwood1]|nr:unnamed protein product [Rotaria sp. Silwood1]
MLSTNPKSLDFEVPELYSTTHSGENFLIYDSTYKKTSCEVILIDGTFKTRPIMFSQVYVIIDQHLGEKPQYAYLDFEISTMNALENRQWATRISVKYWNLEPMHQQCNNSVEGRKCFEGYSNRLQHRFDMHP